jgi:hypothetical protein
MLDAFRLEFCPNLPINIGPGRTGYQNRAMAVKAGLHPLSIMAKSGIASPLYSHAIQSSTAETVAYLNCIRLLRDLAGIIIAAVLIVPGQRPFRKTIYHHSD